MESTGLDGLELTVTVHVASNPPPLTVIRVLPALLADTLPLLSTVATEELLETHLRSLKSIPIHIRLNLTSSPTVILRLEGVNSKTFSTGALAATTFTVAVSDLGLLAISVKVMVAVPSFTAVTKPFSLTVATDSSLENHFLGLEPL